MKFLLLYKIGAPAMLAHFYSIEHIGASFSNKLCGMSETWCTIESDPGVFTELIEEIGVKNVEVNELWSLDDLQAIPGSVCTPRTLTINFCFRRVHGLIFLFKWRPEDDPRQTVLWSDVDVFFARQATSHFCDRFHSRQF